MPTLHLAGEPAADELLARDPFALIVGMLLDQQFPMERAFAGPALLASRLGVTSLDPRAVAGHDPDTFVSLVAGPPAVHRYPAAMSGRIQKLASYVVEHHGGDAAAIWRDVDTGAELYRRIRELPGFGEQKSRILVALLGKQLGVRPAGWREAAGPYGEDGSRRSVADVVDEQSLQEVRDFKREAKRRAKA
jgi:uncharacterized HhH-GPD family protein